MPTADASIQYLAPYVFEVAITDHRTLKVAHGRVAFSYRKSGSARLRTLRLDALECIRRFLQHVLPAGFMKVRYCGFLSPNAKVALTDFETKVELAHGSTVTAPEITLPPWSQPAFQACGGRLRFHRSLRARRTATPWPTSAGPPAPTTVLPAIA